VAHSKSALKRWRQNERARERNKSVRSASRTSVRNAREAITGGSDADAAIREATRVLDRAAKRNVIHKNAAARQKSRLMKQRNRAATSTADEAPKRTRRATGGAAKKTATKRAPRAKS
jgi:small subunit ribosomal protein S20